MNFDLLYKDIQNICKAITKEAYLTDDLVQEVALVAYSLDDIEVRYKDDTKRVLTYLYAVAYKMWNFKTTPFYRKNKKYLDFESDCLDDYKHLFSESDDIDVFELLSDLNEIESIWVCEYYKRNCSINKLSLDAKISRPSIGKKLNEIFLKIRKK